MQIKSSKTNLPDYIFFEVNSPDLNGRFFLDEYEQLKIDENNIGRIIVLTCSIDQRHKEKALRFPSIGGYIIKPLTVSNIHLFFEKNTHHQN